MPGLMGSSAVQRLLQESGGGELQERTRHYGSIRYPACRIQAKDQGCLSTSSADRGLSLHAAFSTSHNLHTGEHSSPPSTVVLLSLLCF